MDVKLKKALKKLSVEEKLELEKEARLSALSKMSDGERREILAAAQYAIETLRMVAGMDGRRPQLFGDESALELLSKVGQWMNDNEITPETEIEDVNDFIDALKAMGAYSATVR